MAKVNLERRVLKNQHYRNVLLTGNSLQLVLMNLRAGEEVPWETHPETDQFIRVEDGSLLVEISRGNSVILGPGDALIIPSKTRHRLSNANIRKDVRFYTIYQNIEHTPGLIEKRQEDAVDEH